MDLWYLSFSQKDEHPKLVEQRQMTYPMAPNGGLAEDRADQIAASSCETPQALKLAPELILLYLGRWEVLSACPPTKGPAYGWPHPSFSRAQCLLKVDHASMRHGKLECAKVRYQ